MQPARDIPQVLASMVQIDDLGRTREMQVGVIPDPFGAVAHDDFLCRTVPAAIVYFPVEAFAKRLGVLNGSRVSSGIGIADRVSLLVPGGLGEDAAELDFPGVGGPSLRLALSAHCLFPDHRYSRSIHLDIQDRDRFSRDYRQVQLHGSLNLPMLALRDIASDGFRRALHGLCRFLPPR